MEYTINLNGNRANIIDTGLCLCSGDKGIVFRFNVSEIDTSNTTAKIIFKRPNNTSVESSISEINGVYTYTIIGNELSIPGKVVADLKFYNQDETLRVSTNIFSFNVSSDTADGFNINTSSYSNTLEQLTAQYNDLVDDVTELINDNIPVATTTTKGGVKASNDVNVASDGTMSVPNKLDKTSVVNNTTTTETGFALDATQINPNVANSFAERVTKITTPSVTLASGISGTITCQLIDKMCVITMFNVVIPANTSKWSVVANISLPSGFLTEYAASGMFYTQAKQIYMLQSVDTEKTLCDQIIAFIA